MNKKILAVLMAVCMLLAGCDELIEMSRNAENSLHSSVSEGEKNSYKDGVVGERGTSEEDEGLGGIIGGWFSGGAKYAMEEAAMPAAMDGYAEAAYPGGDQNWYSARTLTAKEWSDYRNPSDFVDFLSQDETLTVLGARALSFGNIVKVSGLAPLGTVKLLSGETVLYEARADIRGEAVLISADDRTGETLLIETGEDRYPAAVAGRITEVSLGAQAGLKADKLDLMLMIDTTGSMGDELEYLKAELQNVVESVYAMNPGMSIRTSVNFYRDEGDDYVVLYYDFREDVADAVELLKSQSANGGGDYPEAVHTALENAVFGHVWREDAVKLCYLVLDAPPHNDGEIVYQDHYDDYTWLEKTDGNGIQGKVISGVNDSLKGSVSEASRLGIRIIPVVASGVNKDLETLGRGWAFSTGGTYIYLTNDSGIGHYHETPEAPDSQLEYLNDCMIRVTAEYCGLTYVPPVYPEPTEWPDPEPIVFPDYPIDEAGETVIPDEPAKEAETTVIPDER